MLEDLQNPTSSRRPDRAWRATIYMNAGCSKQGLREAKKRGWPNHTTFPLRGLGRAERETVRGSLRVRDSTSSQAQKPIQSAFGWETGERPQRLRTPIQNEFGWGMCMMVVGCGFCPCRRCRGRRRARGAQGGEPPVTGCGKVLPSGCFQGLRLARSRRRVDEGGAGSSLWEQDRDKIEIAIAGSSALGRGKTRIKPGSVGL